VYFSRLLHFYQAYSTCIMHYCYVTGGTLISFQISRSTGVSVATAFRKTIIRWPVTLATTLHPEYDTGINPGQGQPKYECVAACTCPWPHTVMSKYLITKQNADGVFKEW